MKKHLWFRSRSYGWGWTPITWQGWLTIIIYLALVLLIALPARDAGNPDRYTWIILVPSLLILTGFLFIFCSITGEWPHWQWGQKRKGKK